MRAVWLWLAVMIETLAIIQLRDLRNEWFSIPWWFALAEFFLALVVIAGSQRHDAAPSASTEEKK